MKEALQHYPLVSILTTVKNGELSILETIRSVQMQSYSNVEYIIIDGGSTDRTIELIQSVSHDKMKFYKEKDKGVYHGMNNAIAKSKGDIIAILNCGDTFFNDNVISKIAEIYRQSQDKHIVINGGIRLIDKAGSGVQDVIRDASVMRWKYFIMPVNHPAFFVARTIYEKYGAFNTEFRIAADYEFVLRISKNKVAFYFIPDICTTVAPLGLSSYVNDNKLLLKEAYNVRALFVTRTYNKIIDIFFLLFLSLSVLKRRYVNLQPKAKTDYPE